MYLDYIHHLQYHKGYSKHTITSYKKDIEDFISFLELEYESLSLNQVNFQILRFFVSFLTNRGLSSRSINRKITAIKSFYEYKLKNGLVDVSPARGLQLLKVEKKVQVPFSEKEIESLLDNLEVFPNDFIGLRDRLIIELLYSTGVRRSELTNISWDDIDENQKTIKIFGKGSKQRIVPIIESLSKSLFNFKKETHKKFTLLPSKIFVNDQGKVITQNVVYNVVNSYFSRVSTKQKKSPHILRHSFAVHLLDSGAEINAIKELLGHTTLASTQVYLSANINKMKQVINQSHPRGDQN